MFVNLPVIVLTLALPMASQVLSGLSPVERQAFDRIASQEFCGCDSARTLKGCLETMSDCALGDELGQVILRGIRAGLDDSVILAFLSRSLMTPFCATAKDIKHHDMPWLGNPNATITLIEFADFRCGHCRAMASVVKDGVKKAGARVRFALLPFPLQDNPSSVRAAKAYVAASLQGKGIEMAELLFAHGNIDYPETELMVLAARLKLQGERFASDMRSKAVDERVQQIKKHGESLGVRGTPAFFMNGREFNYHPQLLNFDHGVDLERARQQGNCQ